MSAVWKNAPSGWFVLGTHVEGSAVEFSGEIDEDGLPLWERPVSGDEA